MATYKLPIITGTALSVGDLLRWNGTNWVNYSDANWDAAYSHISADGSSHTFIDQDVKTTASPTFNGITLSDTTSSSTGIITKNSSQFIHNYHNTVGGGAVPAGNNIFIGKGCGNFTMGSTATNTWEASTLIGIGHNCFSVNTLGNQSVAIGEEVLHANTTGCNNLAIGPYSMYSNTTGQGNVAMGLSALSNCQTGTGNLAFGRSSLGGITSGYSNVGIGKDAGRYLPDASTLNQTTNTSIYVGNYARASSDGVTNEVVIGSAAVGLGSNTITLGTTSVLETRMYGSVTLGERSSKPSPTVANYGYLWVKNNTPNELWFTNDAGTDTRIA